jgi:hypothetical protein
MDDLWYIVDCKTGRVFWHGTTCLLEDGKTLDGHLFGKAKEQYPDGAWCCVRGLHSLMECIFLYNKLNYLGTRRLTTEEAMAQIIKYSPCPRPNPYTKISSKK